MDHQDSQSTAGRSALREYHRRRVARQARARRRLGGLGVLLARILSEPQSTHAWKQGAQAELVVAAQLERRLRGHGAVVLHDRRIPYGGNIDHLVISAGGVTIIDTKSSHGRLQLKTVGGLLSPRQELFLINGRDRSHELHKLQRQLDAVNTALTRAGIQLIPSCGVLCYPYAAGIPLLGTIRTQQGTAITRARGAARLARRGGSLTPDQIAETAELLATRFPPA